MSNPAVRPRELPQLDRLRPGLPHIDRREFVKLAGSAVVAGAAVGAHAAALGKVCFVLDQSEPATSAASVKWAMERLQLALLEKGIETESTGQLAARAGVTHYIVVARPSSQLAASFACDASLREGPESVGLTPGHVAGVPAMLVSATDVRGFGYGLMELAERVQYGNDAAASLQQPHAVREAPANQVRSMARAFCSEVEDKPWFYDKQFWRGYLDVLALSRFNRFSFTLGLAYDFPRGVTDDYFHLPYPYLLTVPGYDVHVVPLAEGERERNLATLQFIAAETAARGIQFQLGLWTHAYAWTDSPNSTHHIVGLTPQTHATYCRDALAMLLKACPQIEGLTFRVHGESGIPEGSYPFWKTLFEAIPASGRRIEIDMHAKGINQEMFDIAAATGMPVKVSPKFSAEHQGLGYHQADIRALEIPKPGHIETGAFSVSSGDRLFTRYGYADLFQEGRKFHVLFRLWPGTQRHLLWGDPQAAAAYGRAASFCGASGMEIFEPLFFKGREGSGLTGGRLAYADETLTPAEGEWKKFEYTYRLWGRLLYNPDADPETWRRFLRKDFAAASAEPIEAAVGNASRVLPLLTTAHLPSASNHSLWYEMYENMPIVQGEDRSPYSDTPTPRCFATVSALDPQLFSTITDHTKDVLAGIQGAKYSPQEVAQWLDGLTAGSEEALAAARRETGAGARPPQFRRMEEDVLIQIGLGRFFAAKLRSGLLFEVYRHTGDPKAGLLALAEYKKARAAWDTMAERAKGVYRADISYGSSAMRRGHWIDRLAHIDDDIAAMHQQLEMKATAPGQDATAALARMTARVRRPAILLDHAPAGSFRPGEALPVLLGVDQRAAGLSLSLVLHYRHVNHAERWQAAPMIQERRTFHAAVPAAYTNSPYPLQYYFEVIAEGARLGPPNPSVKTAWLHPSLNATLANQPYYVVWRRIA
jgi:hypothetical protein